MSVGHVVAEDRLRGVLDARGQATIGAVVEVHERDRADPDRNMVVADYGRWWSGAVVESLGFRTQGPAVATAAACVLAVLASRRRSPVPVSYTELKNRVTEAPRKQPKSRETRGELCQSLVRSVDCSGGLRVNGGVESYRNQVLTAAVLAPLVVCAALVPFRHSFDNANAALLLVLVVVAVASFGIRPAGVVAAVSSAVWFDFFLTVPYNRLTIANRDDIETTVLLVVIGAAVTEIALWGRRQQARASRQSGYLTGVMTTSHAVAQGGSADDVIDQVRAELTAVLGIDESRFVAGGKRAQEPQLNADGSVTRGEREYKVERVGLPTDAEIELVVQHAGVVRGRFLLTAATRIARPDLEQRLVAVALADQVGAALASQENPLNHP